jgi:hypothetical protein
MSQPNKPKGAVHVYYDFPPEGCENAPYQFTLEQVRPYLSNKPLRYGPQRRRREDERGEKNDDTSQRPDDKKASDPGTP